MISSAVTSTPLVFLSQSTNGSTMAVLVKLAIDSAKTVLGADMLLGTAAEDEFKNQY